jgi:phosphopantothenoylcysteine synthetase/decarboxylase
MDAYPRATGRVLYLVACAAPLARRIGELVEYAQRAGWTVCVVATPRAATWMDVDGLARRTGYPVRSDFKHPDEPDVLPRPDAIAVVPATFNTVNKWAAGISDTLALGLLNEAVGLALPILVVPYVKPPLADHPAYARSIKFLTECGVRLTSAEALHPEGEATPRWSAVVDALSAG